MRSGRVTILLAVRNGAAHLPAQLDSIAAQRFGAWDMIAGDDGSRDASPAILAEFAARMRGHAVELVAGPERGTAPHFLSLLRRAPETARWIAFADQDDVWVPEKLERAVEALAAAPEDVPGLYCSRTWVTGPELETPVLSPDWHRPLGFRNALVQNVASGNTIVLNRAAIALAQRAAVAAAAREAGGIPVHDWWLYQIVTGAGGRVIHDTRPSLYYRQHPGNQLGANRGVRAAIRRARKILNGVYSEWNSANIAALDAARDCLTEENRACLDAFAELRRATALRRLRGLAGLGLYRQTALTQAALWSAAALGRI